MGRWGHCLFGHDVAIGNAIKVIRDITQGNDRHFAHMMDKLLVKSPLDVASFYAQDYGLLEQLQGEVDESIDRLVLQILDSGLGDELFRKYRAAEQDSARDFGGSMYLQIVFAAVLMEYGAAIKEAHVDHLRELVTRFQCNEKRVNALVDHGFRGPGKRQFLTALDHYQAGKPRSFQEPSCHCCGKINDDIKAEGKTLLNCGGCKNHMAAAWFCDKDCQRTLWKRHKPNCGAPGGSGIAVFTSYGKTTFGVITYAGFNV